ncbi:MAG TPA: SCO family protein [Patescibacteria group bacterium]|nr:SCO family protein [Patescibacteria group bacterium]
MSKFLRFMALAVIGFMLGGLAAYIGNRQSSPVPAVTPGRPVPAFDVVGKDGNIILIKPGDKTPGTEDPASVSDELAAQDAPTSDQKLTKDQQAEEGVTPALLEKQALLRRHSQPAIGMYVPGLFTLKDHDGNIVTEKSWPGKFLLVFFGFTQCPDICPVTAEKMGKIIEKLGPLGERVQPLFITIDPDRDTPAALKAYVTRFHKSMLGLTGSEKQLERARESFKVFAERLPGATAAKEDDVLNHSALVYFMSPDNRLEEIIRTEMSTDRALERIQPYLLGTAVKK